MACLAVGYRREERYALVWRGVPNPRRHCDQGSVHGRARAVRTGLSAKCRSVAKGSDDASALRLRCRRCGCACGGDRRRPEGLAQANLSPVGGDLIRGPEAGRQELLQDAVHELLAFGSEWWVAGQPGRTYDQAHAGRGIEAGPGPFNVPLLYR